MSRTQREQSVILREQFTGKRPQHPRLKALEFTGTMSSPKPPSLSFLALNEKYPKEWTTALRRFIKQRDSYLCCLCNSPKNLHVHYIDYNKNNCNHSNLITLCRPCLKKTNFNRQAWYRMFMDRLNT